MDMVAEIRSELGSDWLAHIYASRVRTQRTRSINLPILPRENTAHIQYTLLGIELKVGKRRIACPDLASGRYMRVFARLGITDFAVPYNITKISAIADELETAWLKMVLIFDLRSKDVSPQAAKRLRNRLIKTVREEIGEIGAGESMPAFESAASTRRA